MRKTMPLVLPVVAAITTLLTGCAGLGLGKSEPMLSPAARAAAEMPAAPDPVVNTEETYAALVRQMQAKSLWFASLAHLDAMDKQWGVSTESRLLRADALRRVGQLNASIALYQGLLGTAKDGAARYGLGRVAAEKGDFRSAAVQMEQARVSNPVDPQLLTDLGYAYLQARDINAARMPLMQAAQLNPEDAQASVNLSLFLMVSGQAKEAEAFMKQRKLDAQTQLAVKEQASQWLKEPVPSIKPNVTVPAQEAKPVAMAAAPVIVERTASQIHPTIAASEVPVAAQSVQQPAATSAASSAPSTTRWMVSDTRFDSARPSRPGSEIQAVAVYIPPPAMAPVAPVTAVAVVEPSAPLVAQPVMAAIVEPMAMTMRQATKPAQAPVEQPVQDAVSTPAREIRRPDPTPTSPQMALVEPAASARQVVAQPPAEQERRVVKTAYAPLITPLITPLVAPVARPAVTAAPVVAEASGVRRVTQMQSQAQSVQTLLPKRTAVAGLFFETPDEPQRSAEQTAANHKQSTEKAWP